jgi:putative membrane protein
MDAVYLGAMTMWWNMPYPIGAWRWMPFHGVFFLLLVILLIIALAVQIRFLWSAGNRRSSEGTRQPGLEVLEERYARGEIQRDEYLQKKRDLGA